MDVKHAADMYALDRTLRLIGAELGVHWSTVRQQLERAGRVVVSVVELVKINWHRLPPAPEGA